MQKTAVLSITLIFWMLQSICQDRVVIDDRTGMVSGEVEDKISDRLYAEGLEYTSTVDFKSRCDYYFAVLREQGGDIYLKVNDCDDNVLGRRNLGNRLNRAEPGEAAFLIGYTLTELISSPGKYTDALPGSGIAADGTGTAGPSGTTAGTPGASTDVLRDSLANEHDSRYFFAPSAFNLKQGELYYNTVYFFLHDVQYGVTDYFSIGLGTSLIGIPIYLTPKVSIPVGEKSAIAVGDVLILGTYGSDAIGNLVYGNFTTGGTDGNISLGAGYLATNENDITEKTSSLVFNLSGLARISPHIFLLTENYIFGVDTRQYAYQDYYDPDTDTWIYLDEDFTQNLRLWYGIAGFRILSKKQDLVSWQIGLTYVAGFYGEIPRQYTNWETSASSDFNVIAFPTITYTRKFGKKY